MYHLRPLLLHPFVKVLWEANFEANDGIKHGKEFFDAIRNQFSHDQSYCNSKLLISQTSQKQSYKCGDEKPKFNILDGFRLIACFKKS